LISVRSEVQVFPGPPFYAAGFGWAAKLGNISAPDGAIAQLGERVLCKHEVVGSIPSGSTRCEVGLGDRRRFVRKQRVCVRLMSYAEVFLTS
jgi:hypothetical protein